MLGIAFKLNKISKIVLEQGTDNIGVLSPVLYRRCEK